ncbi:baseplate J/gp47 family protein [Yersinia kristensenii]|uniref:baseplate J/gp47 family protein n=1 Tax=Yersinia kristensenii TaxID=28152 RepID=UPI0001A54281|nr:baseplate J/gp47 family protein [Yersinia kristensenii]EEP89190.1 hypothetical protein ykris0001_2510 [Yersinia kristensenii ATCC 33638]PEH52742.1 hypothetical protein CRM81_04890 [Yersinia kristensenii]SUP70596.1 Uncharacterized homolog of phage Mu protein gp47 [Yersinia kristensenii]
MYEEVIAGMLPVIDRNGITAPDFQTILEQWKTIFRGIYGEDIYIEPDSKDGVLLSLIAYAMHGCNNAVIGAYNSFSPSTAVGEGLSRNVKINGISRKPGSYSTVDLLLSGRVGTVIKNGAVRDKVGNVWQLPESVTLDLHGEAVATAVCQTSGAISAMAGDIIEIATPTLGWQTVTNPQAAVVGRNVEKDTELRIRQAQSVAMPSRTVIDGLRGALANLNGVTRQCVYDNDTNTVSDIGIPAYSIACVVEGGDSKAIAETIALKKTPGIPTYGTTIETIKDAYGNEKIIKFFRPEQIPIFVEIKIKPLAGYTTDIGNSISSSVSEYINSLYMGDDVYLSRLFVPANLSNSSGGETYNVLSIEIGTSQSVSVVNIDIAFNQVATCKPENVKVVTVVS